MTKTLEFCVLKHISVKLFFLSVMFCQISALAQDEWTPSEIVTLLWLDGEDESTVIQDDASGKVSQWIDKSSFNNHATQADVDRQPDYGLDSGVSGTESNSGLSLDLPDNILSSVNEATVVFVGKNISAKGGWGMYSAAKPSQNKTRFPNSDGTLSGSFATEDKVNSTVPVTYTQEAMLIGAEIQTTSQHKFRFNGEQIGDAIDNTPFSGVGATTMLFGSSIFSPYTLYEVLFVSGSGSYDVIAKKLEGYLAHKWNLETSLSSNHPYALNPPLTSDVALQRINDAAKANDASNVTLADIASVESFSYPIVEADLATYQTIIANAAGFTDASEIIAAFAQRMTILASEVNDGETSGDASLSLTFTTLYATSDFDALDISTSNGTVSNFASTSDKVYTATFAPSADGATTIDVAANTFTDTAGNSNIASEQFNWTYFDPTLTITGDITESTDIVSDVNITSTGSLTLESDAGIDGNVEIANGGELTLIGTGIITGNVSISDGGSLIAEEGSITGTITYERAIPTNNWYLISSPVVGQGIDDFVEASNLAGGAGSNIGLADYDNSTGTWSYYQLNASGTGDFVVGQGHAAKLEATGGISFSGDFNDANVDIALTTTDTSGFNLIGNPYLASISVSEILNANDSGLLDEQTIWLWDQAADAYVQKNLAEDLEIAPGQGFFVLASAVGDFSLTEDMQSHNTDDTFRSKNSIQKVELILSNGEISRMAQVFYIDGATLDFDNGYDSSVFGGFSNEFAVYTRTLSNDTGRKLGIQSLPPHDYESMIIPVGVNAVAGSTLEFSALSSNLPTGLYVYLEDKATGVFTRIDNGNYSVSVSGDLNDVGRFYVHTSSSELATPTNALDNINVYVTNNQLKVEGIAQGEAQVQMYSILGKQIFNTIVTRNSNNVTLPRLQAGIYLVAVQAAQGTLHKKLIIE